MTFDERYAEYLGMIEPALAGYFGRNEGLPFDGLLEAMDYSLMAGGKRLRPMLVLEFCRVCGGDGAPGPGAAGILAPCGEAGRAQPAQGAGPGLFDSAGRRGPRCA